MKPIIVAIDDRLANPGDTLSLAGHLDEESYALGEHEFCLPHGIEYDLVLTNAGEGILVTGILKTCAVGECDRCLAPASMDIAAEVDEYYLFEEPEHPADDEDEADYSLVSSDKTIDLADALLPSLVMETPFVVLCKPDCKGLCPVCGANLNEEDCGHAAQVNRTRSEERLDSNPFSVLAGLTFDDEKNSEESVEDSAEEGAEDSTKESVEGRDSDSKR